MFEELGVSGCGGVIYSDTGTWLLGFEMKSFCQDILVVELHAMILGMRLGWDYGYQNMIIETDCLQALFCINRVDKEQFPKYMGPLLEIHELLDIRWNV